MSVDEDAQTICRRLLVDQPVAERELRDPALREEVRARLAACGFRFELVSGSAYAVSDVVDEETSYSEPQLAALALALVELVLAPDPDAVRPGSVELAGFCVRLGDARGWSKAWIRRAVLAPLERDGYLRVIQTAQRRSDERIEAGPRLALLDAPGLGRALDRLGEVAA